jgi:hypothetical protein
MADFPPCDDVCGAVEEHVRRVFAGSRIEASTWNDGPILRANPHFRVLRVAPSTPDGLWHYVSVGSWAATADSDRGLEFVLSTPTETTRAVELLAMNVFYHRGGRLDLGHTVAIGEPWLPGSRCDHWLVSLPYPFDPELGETHVGARQVDFRWLVPITAAERDFKEAHGQELLEQRFEAVGLRYWEVDRDCVVGTPGRWASRVRPAGTRVPVRRRNRM